MNGENQIINWLLAGDVSIQYQVHRDLLGSDKKVQQKLQARIETQGWGKSFLSRQQKNGHWGKGFYQPKWTSTHYTLLDLKNLGIPRSNPQSKKAIKMIFEQVIGPDNGVNYARTPQLRKGYSDVCINGMVLNIASYFGEFSTQLDVLIDLLFSLQMEDGGWNCQWFQGATHSSMHTTLSVLEGLLEYKNRGKGHQLENIKTAEKKALEFLLEHQLCRSHRTGAIIDQKMLRLSFPCRWRYDILRIFDYIQFAGISFDQRMNFALKVLLKKQRQDKTWPLQNRHPGQAHFEMEKPGQPSRWNTLRALRVLKHFKEG